MNKGSGTANFTVFLGGMMVVAAMVAPYFRVELGTIETFFVTGIILVLSGLLYRRFITKKASGV